MIRSTFQLASGVGPWRERQLWAAGVTTWEAFPGEGRGLSPGLDARLRAALDSARAALGAGDAERLAAMLPRRERWRLFGAFAEDAGYLDIETDGGETITAVGVLDRDGPRVFLRGRDLDDFPEATRGWKMVVTFNGAAFDLPLLRRAFPGWRPPLAHVDLRQLWGRLGHQGGLKLLERETGLERPPHLDGLGGLDAVRLWHRHLAGEREALRLLAEYNLYDAVNLRTLMALGYNRLVERLGLPTDPARVSFRGDVLYDLTREVLRL